MYRHVELRNVNCQTVVYVWTWVVYLNVGVGVCVCGKGRVMLTAGGQTFADS